MHGLFQFFSVVLSLVLALSFGQVQASEGFFDQEGRKGFYWYERAIAIEEEEFFQQPATDTFTYEDLWLINPETFKTVLNNRFNLAIQTPTRDNVYRYLQIQDVAKRKSKAFAGVMGMVSQTHPEFSGRNITTMPESGKKAYYRIKNQELHNLLKDGQKNFALIVFESSGCGYCIAQRPIIEAFQAGSGWSVRYIDIDENRQLSAKYNIDTTPTIMMLSRQRKALIHIAKGVVALADLQETVARTVSYISGQTTAQQWFRQPGGPKPDEPAQRGRQQW
jgi:conjugal transfer pilus assembly protein TraF